MTTRPNISFRQLVLVVLFLSGCAFLISLGLWQLDRAAAKRERHAAFSAALAAPTIALADVPANPGADAFRWRRAAARGRYLEQHILLDNRVQRGRAGYEVLTPFLTDAGHTVLVNRGFVPLPGSRELVPEIIGPRDATALNGFLGEPPVTGVALNADARTSEWMSPHVVRVQQLDIAEVAVLFDLRTFPVIFYLDADEPGALAIEWTLPGDGSARHVAYAVQWFAMAIVLAAIGVWNWRKAAKRT